MPINRQQRDEILAEFNAYRGELMDVKGKSYAGTEDVLANFKRMAERFKVSPSIVWGIFMLKHVDSICSTVANDPDRLGDCGGEPFIGRLADLANYTDLGAVLLKELEQPVGETH